MYIGIDLGTSNSSIVQYSNGAINVALTKEGSPILPSVIYIGSNGSRLFGQRAYEQTILEPQNVVSGFKRLMGTSTPIELSSGIAMTPEEASTEIIRQLISQLNQPTENITGCIITIPAAFNQMQSEATLRAAKAAGLEQVALLQEPIAASMAAMAKQNSSGLFLIYDLGGGTFDIALVQSIAGNLNILDNMGINMLGGRDFDHSILANHLIPALKQQYKLPDDFIRNPQYKQLLRIAQLAVEKAKIELSTQENTTITASADIIMTKDLNNNEIMLEIPLSRTQLRELIQNDVQETINLSQRIINKNGYTNADISKVIFIGGPSKMPWLRELVSESLKIAADFSIDPMTAVSEGAAIYAESRHWEDTNTARKQTRTSTKAGDLAIQYDYPSRVTRDTARIKVLFDNKDNQNLDIQIDSSLGWTSGKTALNATTEIKVSVPQQGDNHYKITVFDHTGQIIQQATTDFVITRVYASISGIPATHTIAAKIVVENEGILENSLEPVIEKGTLLPVKGVKAFRAARPIHAGEDEYIDLELYQQEHVNDKPEDCLAVGAFRIKGSDLLPGMSIRKGDEIICQWHMNDSGILKVAIDVPSVGQTFDTGHMYVDSAGHRNFDQKSGEDLVKASLDQTTEALKEANEVLGEEDKAALAEAGKKLQDQRRALSHSAQPEELRRITENLRDVRQKIASTVNAPHNKARMEEVKINGIEQNFKALIDNPDNNISEAEINRFNMIVANARAELAKGDEQSVKEASKLAMELTKIYVNEAYKQPVILINIFRGYVDRSGEALDKEMHERLIKEGYEHLENKNFIDLRRVLDQLASNMIEQTDIATSVTELSGLMRG